MSMKFAHSANTDSTGTKTTKQKGKALMGSHPLKCCLGTTAKRSDLTVYGCRARLAAIAGVC